MDRKNYFFEYNQAKLHYSMNGNGTQVLFCFHGYGLSSDSFYELEEAFKSRYTIYNFDLFFHGKSEWGKGEEPITEKFLKDLFEQFCRQHSINSFSLLGYSIGARMVWSLAQVFPNLVKEIIVIAPDGITDRFWYLLATKNIPGKKLFKFLLSDGNRIEWFIKTALFLRIVPKVTARFAESQLVNKEQRNRVYYTWITFRKLKANTTYIASIVNTGKTSLTIYLGAQDSIITYKAIEPLAKKLTIKNIITLEARHSTLVTRVIEYLSSIRQL